MMKNWAMKAATACHSSQVIAQGQEVSHLKFLMVSYFFPKNCMLTQLNYAKSNSFLLMIDGLRKQALGNKRSNTLSVLLQVKCPIFYYPKFSIILAMNVKKKSIFYIGWRG